MLQNLDLGTGFLEFLYLVGILSLSLEQLLFRVCKNIRFSVWSYLDSFLHIPGSQFFRFIERGIRNIAWGFEKQWLSKIGLFVS